MSVVVLRLLPSGAQMVSITRFANRAAPPLAFRHSLSSVDSVCCFRPFSSEPLPRSAPRLSLSSAPSEPAAVPTASLRPSATSHSSTASGSSVPASPPSPPRRQYAFEFPTSGDRSAEVAASLAAQRAIHSDRCTNSHYAAFIQRRAAAAAPPLVQSEPLPASPFPPSPPPPPPPPEQSDPVEPDAFAVSYPRPLPLIYASTASTALPPPTLNTPSLRLYNVFIWLLCSGIALYVALEYEQSQPSSASGPDQGQQMEQSEHVFTPLRRRWKGWKERWQQQPPVVVPVVRP